MSDKLREYKELIKLMEATLQAPPPSGFTENVMRRLPEYNTSLLFKLKRVLNAQVVNRFNFGWTGEVGGISKTECFFYFCITSFFYLILGIILLIGSKGINSSMEAMDWIRLQPHLTLGIAMWLLVLGIVLLIEMKNKLKVIRFGILLYIFLAIVNGALIHLYFSIPYAGIFIFGFIGAGILMGVMLVLAVQKVDLRLVS